jgi:hypothetical protein
MLVAAGMAAAGGITVAMFLEPREHGDPTRRIRATHEEAT